MSLNVFNTAFVSDTFPPCQVGPGGGATIYIYICGTGFLWFNWLVGENCCMFYLVCLGHRINGTGIHTFTVVVFFLMVNEGKYSISDPMGRHIQK